MTSTAPEATPAERSPRLIALATPFLGILGATQGSAPNIASTALVSVSKDLKMDAGLTALAAGAQTLAIAATVITTGLLADRFGRRKVLQVSLITGLVGCLVAGLAPAALIYVLGQVIIGVGLGATYGAAFAYVRAVAKEGKLAAALGLFGATVGLSSLVFMLVGSLLVGVNWRLSMVFIAVLCALWFVVTPLVLPHQPRLTGENMDVPGQLLLGFGIVAFLYGVAQMAESLTAPRTLGSMAAGALLIAGFFVREARGSHPFYPVHLFKSPIFISAILAGLIYNYGTAVVFLQCTNLWQYVTKVPTGDIAVWQLPISGAGIVAALVVGRLMSRGMTNRLALLISSVVCAIGFVLLALERDATTFVEFLPGTILVGAGLVGASIPFGNLILEEAPPESFGPVTSSRTTIGQFFYSIGLAFGTVFVDRFTSGGIVRRLTESGVQPDQISTAVSSVTLYVKSGTEPSTQLGQQALQAASASYATGFAWLMLSTAAIILVAATIAYLLLRRARRLPVL